MSLELISVHVPKTGGTSFWDAIARHYGEALHVDYDHIPGSANDRDLVRPPAHARAVHGHFRGDAYPDCFDAFRITFLRDPVEQFISGYFFWLVSPPHGNADHDRLLAERPDVVTYAKHYAGRMLPAYFEGVDPDSFDYVGFADRREIDYRVLSRIFDFPIDAGVHSNRTTLPPDLEAQRQEAETSPAIQAALRAALSDDYHYYDRFRAQWT